MHEHNYAHSTERELCMLFYSTERVRVVVTSCCLTCCFCPINYSIGLGALKMQDMKMTEIKSAVVSVIRRHILSLHDMTR